MNEIAKVRVEIEYTMRDLESWLNVSATCMAKNGVTNGAADYKAEQCRDRLNTLKRRLKDLEEAAMNKLRRGAR